MTQWSSFAKSLTTAIQPMSYTGNGLAEEGKLRLRTVQAARSAPNGGRTGQTIRVLELRQRFFPGTVLSKASPQRLAACQQTVMRVREREYWKEGEGQTATNAPPTMNPNPVVMLVVSLLAAPPVPNDQTVFTKRATAYDELVTVFRPVGCKPVRRDGNWDKVDRTSHGFRLWLRPAKISIGSGTRLLKKNQLKENIDAYL